jgi:hypothetical protein
MKKQPKKMKLTRESLRCLTGSPADPALQEVAGAAAGLRADELHQLYPMLSPRARMPVAMSPRP